MAVPRLGQKRSDGKVYAGAHYGYQAPATFSKLKKDGELSKGSEARRNAEQAVRPAVQAAKNFQSNFRKATDWIPGINALEKGVDKASNTASNTPAGIVAKGGSIAADKAAKALDIDPKLAATALLVGRVATGGRGGAKPSSSFRPGTTAKLPKSARPTGTVRAGSAAPSKALTQARRSVIRPNTEQAARQASGPVRPSSSGAELAPGNSYVKRKPVDAQLKRSLKQKAETQFVDQATNGYKAKVKQQPRGQDTSNYLPNRGRVSPTDKGRAAQLRDTQEQRLAKALEGKRGQERVNARNAFNREETKRRQNIQRDARVEVQQFQKAQEAKSLKGTTPSSRERMAADMARRPRQQGPKPPPTTTTGTRRVAANPESGTSRRGVVGRVVQGKNGDVTIRPKGNLGGTFASNKANKPGADGKTVIGAGKSQQAGGTPRGIIGYKEVNGKKIPIRANNGSTRERSATNVAGRTINPATGRPYQANGNDPTKVSTKKPSSSTRQPRGGNPQENFPSRPGRAKMEGEFPNRAGGSPIKTAQTQLREAQREQRPGFVVSRPKANSGLKGTSTQDTRQRRNGRTIGRLGQAGQSNVDNPELRRRAAANKARAAATSKPTATPPKRTPERAAQIRQRSRATTQGARTTRGASDKEVRALTNKYNKELPTSPTTHFNGEVRLQGSKYSMDPQAKNLVDGSVSRAVYLPGQRPKPQVRSSEASAKSKETMEAVRRRAAVRRAAEQAMKAKKVKSRSIGNRARAKGTGETRRLTANKQQRTIRGLLQRLRGR
jgi:hypothetical protein